MSLPCTPYGPLAHLNAARHPESWQDSWRWYQPLAQLGGHVALYQCRAGLGFISENPAGSWLFREDPWPQVAEYPGVVYELVD
eukprot:2487648-Lingulodinium_polyedra.AAC.1